MKKQLYAWLMLLAAAAISLQPAWAADLAGFTVQKDKEIITLTVPEVGSYRVFTLLDPERLVVDVPAVSDRRSVSLPPSYKGKLVKAVRFGQFDPGTSRFVFDLARPVKVTEVKASAAKKEKQLIIAIAQEKPEKAVQKTWAAVEAGMADKKKGAAQKEKKESVTAAKKQKPLIIIDPGHGGVDPGAIGPKGAQEKDIVLTYAKGLKAKLLKTGRYRVLLTREDDRFIMLRKRVDIARKAGGAIFLSLHADSAPEPEARGLSVYTVSEKASDQEAETLAARENKSDILAGLDLSEERQDVADILISLAQRETKNRSATLADMLVARLRAHVKLLPNSHRFAGFAVLKAPDVPSVLIEIGFLSHPKEEKLLKSRSYRESVINGIIAGVDAYFDRQKKMEGA